MSPAQWFGRRSLQVLQRVVRWRDALLSGDRDRLFETATWITCAVTATLALLSPSRLIAWANVFCVVVTLTIWTLHRWRPALRAQLVWVLWTLVQAITVFGVLLQGGLWSSAMGYFFIGNVGILIIVSMRAVLTSIAFTFVAVFCLAGIEASGHLPARVVAEDQHLWWLILYVVEFAGFNIATMVVYRIQEAQSLNLKSNNYALAQTHEKLRNQHRVQEQFVASVSHELRTPMNAIMGFLQTIERNEHMSAQQRESLDYMEQSARQLLQRIEELLDFSQLQAGRLRIRESAFDLQAQLRLWMDLASQGVGSKPVRLQLEVAPQVPQWVTGDVERINQILRNLLGNAVKFTLSGTVTLQASVPQPGLVSFHVIDTGPGIEASELDRIFNRLSLITSRTRREMGGTGLGLSITKALVELMHGELQVSSSPGAGSHFLVTLPLARAQGGHVEQEAQGQSSRAEDLVAHVLLVDDSPVNRLVAKNLLRAELPALQMDEASDAFEALQRLNDQAYDLVLMDVVMPGMNGIEATQRVLDRPWQEPPLIMGLTADASEEVRQECLSAGMVGVILKPFDRQALIRPVVTALAKRQVKRACAN